MRNDALPQVTGNLRTSLEELADFPELEARLGASYALALTHGDFAVLLRSASRAAQNEAAEPGEARPTSR